MSKMSEFVQENDDLITVLFNTRVFCGNMHEAFLEWCQENGREPTDEFWCECLDALNNL